MAKENESADYSHRFDDIKKTNKTTHTHTHIYADVSKPRGTIYALVMNTVKLCVRQKNRCSPSAM